MVRFVIVLFSVLFLSSCIHSSADYMYRVMELCNGNVEKYNPHSGIVHCKKERDK